MGVPPVCDHRREPGPHWAVATVARLRPFVKCFAMMWWHWKRRGKRQTGHTETKFAEVPIEAKPLIWGLLSSIAERPVREAGGPWDKAGKRAPKPWRSACVGRQPSAMLR